MDAPVHRYATALRWTGSTGLGYEAYDRGHDVHLGRVASGLAVSADPSFRGDAARANPEQLLLAAASSCHLLSFLAVAARARIDVVAYEDDASAVMPEDDPPMRITRIDLRPVVTVVGDPSGRATVQRLERLHEVAHRECFIANSLRAEIVVTPVHRWVDAD
jgi:organic hydroperoxide reductase OsmC/OhrA